MLDLRLIVAVVVALKVITDATPLVENSTEVGSGVSLSVVEL